MVRVLREADKVSLAEVAKKHGVSEAALESALIAWKHHVADRRIVEEEFKTAFAPTKMREVIRAVTPSNEIYFPGILEFLDEVYPPPKPAPALAPIASDSS